MLLATVINPYGLALHTYIVKHINELLIPQFYVFVSPFRPYFEQPAMRSLLTLMLLIGAGGLITLKKRLPPVLTSLAIIGSLIMIRSLYFSVPFVYFAFPFLALSIQAIGEATAQATEPLLGKNSHYLKKVMHVAVLIFIAVAIWSNISNSIYARSGSASKFGLGFTKNITPANYIDEIVNHPKFPIDILNMPFDGAYLSYKFPSKKFACDLRNDLFSEKNLSNLNLALLGNNDEWKDLTSEYNPKALILNNFSMQSPLILKQFIKREWKLIYFDGAYSILVSPNSEIADIAKEFNGAKKGLESLNAELNQYNKNSDSLIYKPNSPQLIGAGASFLALNRYKEANAVYATILENNHFMKSAWLGYGQSLLGLREFEKASKALEEAVKVMPNNKQALIGLGQAYRLSKNEAGFKFVEKRLEKMNSQSDKNKSAN